MPLISSNVSNQMAIENLVRLIVNADKVESVEDKFKHFEINKLSYESYIEEIKD